MKLPPNRIRIVCLVLIVVIGAFALAVLVVHVERSNTPSKNISPNSDTDNDAAPDADEATPPPTAIVATPTEVATLPRDTSALGGEDVLIADRGNNRLIEVNPQKQIVWEYQFHLPKPGLGADDAFFANGGKAVIVNLEEYHLVELIDYATKQVIWTYGIPGKRGSTQGMLNTPDDAYQLPNGDVIVADIQNCRVIEIAPDKQIVHQYGQTRQCKDAPGFLYSPNGDTPLSNGHILISTIHDQRVLELDEQWRPVFSMKLPVGYPSDPQLTQAGNILISDYRHPGQIMEVSHSGNIVWQYSGDAETTLNKPSLAIELPNRNILANDDFNHRVIVIDKVSRKIIWQYGVTGKPGVTPGQLNIPDGLDIIKRDHPLPPLSVLSVRTIGSVTRHAANFIGRSVRVNGYLLKKARGYVIFSDEVGGAISRYDLPVTGPGVDTVQFKKRYTLEGNFVQGGLVSSNGNPDHLELSGVPQ